jgi:hypothetical protein
LFSSRQASPFTNDPAERHLLQRRLEDSLEMALEDYTMVSHR